MDHKTKSETSIPIAKPKVTGQAISPVCIKLRFPGRGQLVPGTVGLE
jgi:hypothetical protein